MADRLGGYQTPRLWPYMVWPIAFTVLLALGPLYAWHAHDHPIAQDIGVSEGYAYGFLWTWLLGMPWSMPPFPQPEGDFATETVLVALVARGLINAWLISLVAALAWWRATRRPSVGRA